MTTVPYSAGHEDAREKFRVRTYDDLSERSKAMIDTVRASLAGYMYRDVTREEVMGAIADVGGDMAGYSHLTIDQENI